jgi:hypothetical protein
LLSPQQRTDEPRAASRRCDAPADPVGAGLVGRAALLRQPVHTNRWQVMPSGSLTRPPDLGTPDIPANPPVETVSPPCQRPFVGDHMMGLRAVKCKRQKGLEAWGLRLERGPVSINHFC